MIKVRKRIMKMNSSQVSSMEQRWCFGESTRLSTVWPGAPVSRKSRKLFGPEKTFIKLRPANSVKPVFSYVVEGIKNKITVKLVLRDAFTLKIQRELCQPKCARKVSGLSRNGHQGLVSRKARIFSGDIIFFVSSKRRSPVSRNFAVILTFAPFTTYEKTSFTE